MMKRNENRKISFDFKDIFSSRTMQHLVDLFFYFSIHSRTVLLFFADKFHLVSDLSI